MAMPHAPAKHQMTTARGAATRARIIEAASRLVAERGVAETRIDDVMSVSGTGKSQIYHYFADKEALMCAVVEAQSEGVLQFQESCLNTIKSLHDFKVWRDQIIAINRSKGSAGGCPIGSLASELADRSETAREALATSFAQWESHLAGALEAIRQTGELSPAADVPKLATAIITALQGGLLMAQTMRTTRPLEVALDMALEHVGRWTMDDGGSGTDLSSRASTKQQTRRAA
jgi:TetR/AcrR family transcriptional repressor of nem operon